MIKLFSLVFETVAKSQTPIALLKAHLNNKKILIRFRHIYLNANQLQIDTSTVYIIISHTPHFILHNIVCMKKLKPPLWLSSWRLANRPLRLTVQNPFTGILFWLNCYFWLGHVGHIKLREKWSGTHLKLLVPTVPL